jgi:hypothetical protein
VEAADCDRDYSPAKKTVYDQLNQAAKAKRLYFYTEHSEYDPALKEEIYVGLAVETGSRSCLLIERDACTVTNLSRVTQSQKNSAFIVTDTHGGVESYREATTKLTKSLKGEFVLLSPEELRQKLNVRESSGKARSK